MRVGFIGIGHMGELWPGVFWRLDMRLPFTIW